MDTRLRETHLGDWQGLTHARSTPAPRVRGWRGATTPPGRRTAARAASTSPTAACRWLPNSLAGEPEWGIDEPERPVVLVAHGGLIAALTAALLGLPVDNWPVLGGMGNASWVQLSGHGPSDAVLADMRWRLDVWNASAQVANDVL